MALGNKKPTRMQMIQTWMNGHNRIACIAIALVMMASIVGLFLFVAFSGFGASADFIYNQF